MVTANDKKPPVNLVKADVLSKVLALSKRTIYLMAADGRLPCVRIGKTVRFDLAKVEQKLKEGGINEKAI